MSVLPRWIRQRSLFWQQFEAGEFDVCTLLYNEFKSILTQTPSVQQLIPFKLPVSQDIEAPEEKKEDSASDGACVTLPV